MNSAGFEINISSLVQDLQNSERNKTLDLSIILSNLSVILWTNISELIRPHKLLLDSDFGVVAKVAD